MIDVEDIRKDLKDLEDTLNIDTEIIEYLIRDIVAADRIFIIENEKHPTESLFRFLNVLHKGKTSINIEIISNENQFPQDCCEYDCFIVVSEFGEDNNIIEMVENARQQQSYIYAFSSNSKTILSQLSNKFTIISNIPNFEENARLFFKTTAYRFQYFVESDEYRIGKSAQLNLMETPVDAESVRGFYKSPIEERKAQKREGRMKYLDIASKISLILFYLIVIFLIIQFILSLFN